MSDYKQRMIREHRELQERISKLAHMLEGYAEGTLDFTPACSFQLLESQLYAMGTYANILQERAGARSRRSGSGTACRGCLNTRSLS